MLEKVLVSTIIKEDVMWVIISAWYIKNILRKWVCDILHKYRSDRIQWLQTIIVSLNQEALPVIGLPKHLTCLPEVPDRSTLCSVGIYGICWFEVLFWKGHNGFKSCVLGTGTTEKKTSIRQRSANGKTTSDRHMKIIIGVSEIYSCCVWFVKMCTNNKLVPSLLELN